MHFKSVVCIVVFSYMAFADADLTGIAWRLEELNHSSENLRGYQIRFIDDSIAQCDMHCNSSIFRFTVEDQSMTFAFRTVSLAVCAFGNRENEFITAMGKVTRKNTLGTRVYLMDTTDTLMVLSDSAASRLTGHSWLLQSFRQASSRTTVPNPENYTVNFKDDGTVSAKADCNTCGGRYNENSGTSLLSISALACTKMLCGPDSKGDLFAGMLSRVNGYLRASDTLYCFADADTLVFTGLSAAIGWNRTSGSGPSITAHFSVIVKNQILSVSLEGDVLTHIRLFDVRGVCVRSVDRIVDNRVKIGTTGLSAGVYLVRVNTMSGETIEGMIHSAR
jgi:heat shock protein HslJ